MQQRNNMTLEKYYNSGMTFKDTQD